MRRVWFLLSFSIVLLLACFRRAHKLTVQSGGELHFCLRGEPENIQSSSRRRRPI